MPKKQPKKPIPAEWEGLTTAEIRKRARRQDKGEEKPPAREEFENRLRKIVNEKKD